MSASSLFPGLTLTPTLSMLRKAPVGTGEEAFERLAINLSAVDPRARRCQPTPPPSLPGLATAALGGGGAEEWAAQK